MRTQNPSISRQIGNPQKQGNNLLLQLENKVNQALKLDNLEKNTGDLSVGKVNPQEVKNYMAEISPNTVPGMLVPNTVI